MRSRLSNDAFIGGPAGADAGRQTRSRILSTWKCFTRPALQYIRRTYRHQRHQSALLLSIYAILVLDHE